MFAVETKQKKKKRKCVHAKLCSERASFILSESYLKMVFIFLVFNIMRYKILIQAKVYMFAGSTC